MSFKSKKCLFRCTMHKISTYTYAYIISIKLRAMLKTKLLIRHSYANDMVQSRIRHLIREFTGSFHLSAKTCLGPCHGSISQYIQRCQKERVIRADVGVCAISSRTRKTFRVDLMLESRLIISFTIGPWSSCDSRGFHWWTFGLLFIRIVALK